MKNITGIILAGGKSSRMGDDKGMLELKGKKMVEHVISALAPNVDEVIIISNNDNYNNLGCKVYTDIIKDCGPLGGIYTALHYSTTNKNFIVSCDIPNITSEAIGFIISKSTDEDVIVPIENKEIEPLCAMYNKACGNQIKGFLDAGQFKIRNAIEKLNTIYLDVNLHQEIFKGVFTNVNTPNDYEKLK